MIDDDISETNNVELNMESNLTDNMKVLSNSVNKINEEFSIYAIVEGRRINSFIKSGKEYLFIPKAANLSNLELHYTGNISSMQYASFNSETKTISGQFQNESQIVITLESGETKQIIIMQSDVPALFVDLDNSVTLEGVNSGSKDVKYSGALNVIGCDNSKNNISQTIEFKGRGNTTWGLRKKAYQIKLNKKANFLGLGQDKAKKWVLLANYLDPTLLKNKIVDDVCVNAGLSQIPNATYADLYVNRDYVGNYLVCDKIEINDGRVNLTNEKGVLIELDNAYYKDEQYYFASKRGNYYTVKEAVSEDDDLMTRQAMNSFKQALDAFEDELYSSNPSWNKLSTMIDVDSFAKYYLINEFAQNTDSYYSSCYLYKDGDNDVIHMGPTWDYDQAFGYSTAVNNPNYDYTLNKAWSNDMMALYNFPQFATRVNEIYVNNVKPALDKINVESMSSEFANSAKINTLVWSNSSIYESRKNQLNAYVENRKKYYESKYSNSQVEYSTHVENIGWTRCVSSGVSGTEGRSLRLEGLKIKAGNGYGQNVSVTYRTHIQDIGWQNWVSDGELSGTSGRSLRLEAVQIRLNNAPNYSIRYRVHIQNIGWSNWAYDGEIAGTEGRSLRLEAIEIQVIDKSAAGLGRDSQNTNTLINYRGHIQDVGDTGWCSNGEILGTSGRSLRLEGFKIEKGSELPSDVSIEINEHIENIGWKFGLTDKDYIGTKGQALRLEAVSFKLNGNGAENYSIKYRVHVQDIGWQDWKADGKIAGTVGRSLRIEAIQIMILRK